MPTLAIINKSLATSGTVVCICRYDLGNAWKFIDHVRNFLRQVDQQIAVVGWRGVAANGYRRRYVSQWRFENFVRHEAAVAEGPQEVVQLLHALRIGCMNVDGVIQAIGFFGQPAGKSSTGITARAADNIKIDLRHD